MRDVPSPANSLSITLFDSESVAIIGLACRLPGAPDYHTLWHILSSGKTAIGSIPPQRWNSDHIYHPERKHPGTSVSLRAGLLDDIQTFDAGFFGISPREARAIDPQQRLLLEETWHALEDAGLPAETLRGQRVGVYAAAMANDYLQHAASPFRAPDAYSALGVYAALLANRLSAFFGWRGESMTVDSACASSMAALHQARLSLLNGTTDYCIVAGANALLCPWKQVSFSQAGMLSADGLCKTFAADADGYVPGEGAVVLVLRRTRDALAAGDRIHGLLLGTALNHMGPSPAITAPSVAAEAEVVRAALAQARIDPARISYVECHGTGTALGDPIEVEALARVLSDGSSQTAKRPVLIGSIKSNIGHLEAAAGLAGIAKLLLMLRHGQIPPTVNLAADNPLIDFAELALQPARSLTPWQDSPKIAGVSAFGFGGAGGHAILAEAPRLIPETSDLTSALTADPVTLTLSAHDATALKQLAATLAARLQQPDSADLTTWSRALALQRASLAQRLAVTARNTAEAAAALCAADLPIRIANAAAPALTLCVYGGSAEADWQALRRQLQGFENSCGELEGQLRSAGIELSAPGISAFVAHRALLLLLQASGLSPDVWHAFGAARPAVLAAAGVADNREAAYLACYGKVEPSHFLRPTAIYRDGDNGLELTPVRVPPSDWQAWSMTETDSELIELGQRLWHGNHTFRAFLEDWRELLERSAAEDLFRPPWPGGLGLAVAAALCSTCSRWSLRIPAVAARWSAWPLATLISDGLLDRRRALDALGDPRAMSELAATLSSLSRLPETSEHAWLDRQRRYLPELEGLESPLAAPKASLPGEDPSAIVLIIGAAPPRSNRPEIAERFLYWNPADGGHALEALLAELWHRGLDVHRRALGLDRPHLDLPLYPFNRKPYWLNRLPEDAVAVLWETGQSYHASSAEHLPELAVPQSAAKRAPVNDPDWIERIRACVARTLEADPQEIDAQRSLDSQGIDSLISMDLAARIERDTGVKLSPAVIEELNSVAAIAERVAQTLPQNAPVAAPCTDKPARQSLAVRQVHVATPGLLDGVALTEARLAAPGEGEVRVRIRAAGLNFRDLMVALDALPEARGEALGLEFCGEIEALGCGVAGMAVGDRVVGIGQGVLAERALARAELVAPAPARLSAAECAGLPIVYLTVLRALDGAKPGQSILIHAAAGGLGQAAIRFACQAGLKIFATAGSPEKRNWLKAQGIEQVMDSRNADFADEIMEHTAGRGVDWILNSLTGTAVDRGLDCLAQGGVFVEVGKTDIRDPQSVARQRPDIRYRVYDLVAEIRSRPEVIGRQLQAIVAQIENQTLTALPTETFPLQQAGAALQHMARARHRGKIVLLTETAAVSPDASANHPAPANTMPLAVVGMSGRFPGADQCETLWHLLESAQPALGEVPAGRWSDREWAACAHDLPERSRLAWGGFLSDAEYFDHAFFGFSPREARATDPRQRLLLEETWKALHAAGLPWNGRGDSLRSARLGIFVAADAGDHAFKRAVNGAKSDQLALAGNLPSSLAARLAHIFDCDGPALTLDLACASSMGALWAAQQALTRGDCDYAVAAAVSLHVTPLLAAQLAAAGLLSGSGRCRSFTRAADGLVPAEACVALILKPLAQARNDGDEVLAVIESAAVGHDGQGSGFTLPSAASLANLQRTVLNQAGISAEHIDLISAHGVGTRGGDAAEIAALAQTFAATPQTVPLTTLKPLLGHTFAASGLCAVVHAILQLRHNRLLPVGLDASALISECNGERFRLPGRAESWLPHRDGSPRRVLIDTFAINGGQGAVVIAEAPSDLKRPISRRAPPRALQRRRFWLDDAPDNTQRSAPSAPEAKVLPRLSRELATVLQEPSENLNLDASPSAMGLSSLLAIELQHRLQREFGVMLSLAQITGVKRMQELAALLATAAEPETPRLIGDDPEPFAPFPLTELQSAYWSGRQADVPLGGVDCQVYWEFECTKDWPAADLEAAWNRLVKLHPMLRAVIDADAQQRVLPEVPYYRFEIAELGELSPAIAEQRRQALRSRMCEVEIDPGVWPLFRIAFSAAPDSRRLHCALNLLVMDVLSLYALLDQLAALADAPNAVPAAPPITFKQCLQAIRDYRDSAKMHADEKFWSERAVDLPPAPQLPMLKPLAGLGRLTTRRLQARLPRSHWENICSAAQNRGLSQSVAVLAALAGTLAHWTRTPNFTLNLTTHTRLPVHPEINRVIGNFTGTVLLDIEVRPGKALHALAERIAKRLIEHLDHAHYPSVHIIRRRTATLGWSEGIMPVVFTSMLGYEALRPGSASLSPLGTLEYGATRTPQVTLDAQVQSDDAGLLLSWDVAAGVFPEGLPEAVFAAWVDAVAALNTPAGWEQEVAANIAAREAASRALANSARGPVPEEALFAPFLRQAQAHPERIAVIDAERTLHYGELAAVCAAFAARLRELEVRSGELVAVAMPKGWRQIMAAIAVQMAGAAYLPLAPDLPPARFTRLAERGRIRCGLTETGLELAWPDGVEVIFVGRDAHFEHQPLTPPAVDPDSLAYVIFTSGSTGEPKGVMLTHRAALNTCLDINRRFEITPQDRVLALSALSFDLSVWDIFGVLAAGGALVLPHPASASDPAHLAALVQQHQVSVWNSVPMYLELFLAGEPAAESLSALRTVMLSGDWIALDLATRLHRLAPQARVHSLGGATEAAIWSIHYPIDDPPLPGWTSVPYGRALDNQSMQVLDADLKPCPDFVAGDLYIGGIGLAQGYWDDEARTAAAFITHPAGGERLYRTGDLARWREDGLIEFLGRRDGQVKIDGFRVELGEIEAVLRSHAAVREAVAVAPADAQGRRRLAVFYLADTPNVTTTELLEHLRVRLPAYMLPKQLRLLQRLPLTENEKVDRRKLAEWAFQEETPNTERGAGQTADELEKRLLTLWNSVLNDSGMATGNLDPQRNLFEAGADSLTAVVAGRRIAAELGIACSVTEIFEHATVARLARALAEKAPQPANVTPNAVLRPPHRADLRRAFRSTIE